MLFVNNTSWEKASSRTCKVSNMRMFPLYKELKVNMYTYLNTRNEVKDKHLNYKAPLFTTSTIGTHSNKSQRSMNLGLNVMLRNFSSPSTFISTGVYAATRIYLSLFLWCLISSGNVILRYAISLMFSSIVSQMTQQRQQIKSKNALHPQA